MKIIRNKIIPFKGYSAINLFGVLFVRKKIAITERLINHESIHTAQMKELFYIFFYLWYVVEWLFRLVQYLSFEEAYRNISFEREAHTMQFISDYLRCRRKFTFIHYLKNR